jgi:hypothetical protein
MVCCQISDELKETALSMFTQGLSDQEICIVKGIAEQTLRHLQNTYCATGAVSRKPLSSGCPCMLTTGEAKVCYYVVPSLGLDALSPFFCYF